MKAHKTQNSYLDNKYPYFFKAKDFHNTGFLSESGSESPTFEKNQNELL